MSGILLNISTIKENQSNDSADYNFLIYLPPDYHKNDTKKWPLIFFLHGASLRGNDLEKVKKFGIPKLISEGKEFEFIIISPQCPISKDWSSDNWFLPVYEEVKRDFKVDTNQVYLTGMSLGGEGTWYISQQHPNVFAAIAPVCGRTSHIMSIRNEAEKISSLPIWIFHGVKDEVYSVEESDIMFNLLKNHNPNCKYTRYPNFGHWKTHDTTYKNIELYNWFLIQKNDGS